ncbi:hypothetical protein IIA15_06275, partial [candidate division TA06 bacterium]|nr:hypothetical protein [candidate division TA06 bacterium]
QSIDDGSTVPIFYLPRPVFYGPIQDIIDHEFYSRTEDLNDDEQEKVLDKAVKIREVLKSKRHIKEVAKDVAEHFQKYVEPLKMKAQLVGVDREACALYKEELNKHLPEEWTKVVYTKSQKDEGKELLLKHHLKKGETVKKIAMDLFQKMGENPRILIVTDMLLTGFDAPIEQVMYLDKPLRDHRLLQAISRTNRPYPKKVGGIIVDYIGVFKNLKKALHFEDVDIEGVAKEFDDLKRQFKDVLTAILKPFDGITRDGSRDSFLKAIEVLQDEETLKGFKEKFFQLRRLYETIAPDPFILKVEKDFRWLIAVNEGFRKFTRRGERPLEEEIEKIKELIRESVEVYGLGKIRTFKIDGNYLRNLEREKYTRDQERMELTCAIRNHIIICIEKNPLYESLREKLERILKERDGTVLIQSLKELVGDMVKVDEAGREAKKKYNIKDEEYGLLQVLKKHGLESGEAEVQFIKNLIDGVSSDTFSGWQEKRKVLQDIEKQFFEASLGQYSGRLETPEISRMAEEMTQFLAGFRRGN